MITSIEIFSWANDYLEKRISLHELESWLVSMLPVYLSNPTSEAAELVGVIELGLAEINADIRTERSLRLLLRKHLVNNKVTSMQYTDLDSTDLTVATISSTDSTTLEWTDPLPSWSTLPQVEYV
jgi:hypothetical protein